MHAAAVYDHGAITPATASVALVLLAAGAGRRFGGLKQLEGVGPHGEAILEYTIHDAIQAGVGRVVLVVRPETEGEFRKTVGKRLEGVVDVEYVHQNLDPPSVALRSKPWGTAHAVLCACNAVEGPVVIANADDFYGAGAIAAAIDFLKQPAATEMHDHALIGYRLRDTLPDEGRVSRAVCTHEQGLLTDIVESKEAWIDRGTIMALDDAGTRHALTGDESVSMNLWAFRPGLTAPLQAAFHGFLQRHASSPDAEFQLPAVIRDLIRGNQARVRVIPWTGPWCGVTHRGDLDAVRLFVRNLIDAGVYPSLLNPLGQPVAPALGSIVSHFRIDGEFVSSWELARGHIHMSQVVELKTAAGLQRFVLQRINTNIFADPDGLMHNVARVVDHLRRRLEAMNSAGLERRRLNYVSTRDGSLVHRASDSSCWRMCRFIERSAAIEFPRSEADAERAGRAFGEFHTLLSDMPPPPLRETIPHFHDTPRRFTNLEQAIAVDSHHRVEMARAEIKFALSRKALAWNLIEPLQHAELPLRIAHNDAKLSNVLLDADSGEPLCVVDLDTVMPGTVLFDFGDMMRTMLCPAAEDERDLPRVCVEAGLFKGLAKGYITATREFLTQAERDHLVTAGLVITFEQGVRFLTDYLQGDIYYRTTRPDQNLDRCRVQFEILRQLEEHRVPFETFITNAK